MKKIYLKAINKLITFEKSIFNINIESKNIYKDFIFNIEENVILSENNIELSDKYLEIIRNPFEIDINNTKLIKGLYKKFVTFLNEDEKMTKISEIERLIIDVIEDFKLTLDSNITMDDLDYSKLLGAINLKFEEVHRDNFCDFLIGYFKIIADILNMKFVIAFNLFNFFDDNEIEKLEVELEALGIVILNINFVFKDIKSDLIIDNDYCII